MEEEDKLLLGVGEFFLQVLCIDAKDKLLLDFEAVVLFVDEEDNLLGEGLSPLNNKEFVLLVAVEEELMSLYSSSTACISFLVNIE